MLDGQVSRLGALEDLVHESGGAAPYVTLVGPVGHQETGLHEFARISHRRQPALCGELRDPSSLKEEERVTKNEECARAVCGHRCEGAVELARSWRVQDLKLHPERTHRDLRFSQLG